MKHRSLYILILVSAVCKLIIAGITELNNDEVYYWTYTQQLQWSYFDHPPGIALLLKFFTINLFFENEIMLRLGPIVCGAVSTWLIYLIGRKIRNNHTGFIAALLFSASPYCNIIAGLLVIPDAPQLVFWLWSVLLMVEITSCYLDDRTYNIKLLLLGVTIGLCILCKIHGIFLWVGFLLYAMLFQRKIFINRYLYFSLSITVCLLFPILYWNYSNDFITYKYQGSRIGIGSIQWDSFFRELFGEIIYNSPIIFVLFVSTCVAMLQRKRFVALAYQRLLLLIFFPLVIIVLLISLFRDTLPHWTGPAYATMIPAVAAFINYKQKSTTENSVPRSVKWALALTIFLLIAAVGVVRLLPVNIGSKDVQELGKHDVTLDMNGWTDFGKNFDSLYRHDRQGGLINKNPFLISDYWFPAAHINYYVANRYHFNFLAIGKLSAIHHYAWLNKTRPFLNKGDDAYFITVSNFYNPPVIQLSLQFEKVLAPAVITQFRSGIPVREFVIFRLKSYRGNIPRSGILE